MRLQTSGGAAGRIVGEVVHYDGIEPPAGWVFRDGRSLSRTTYAALFAALSKAVTGTTANGSANVTGLSEDLRGKGLEGARIEGAGIPAGTTISAITGATTLTLSANATGTSPTLTIIPYGAVDANNFNVGNAKGRSLLGRDDMGGTAANNVTNAISGVHANRLVGVGGDQRMQSHNHGPGNGDNFWTRAGGANMTLSGATIAIDIAATTANQGAGGSQNMPPVSVSNVIIYTGVGG